MLSIFSITVIVGSILAILGTMIGASISVILSKPSKHTLAFINGIASGIMISITIFDLIPEAIEKLKFSFCLFYIFIGFILMFLLNILYREYAIDKNHLFKTAFFTSMGLMLHNLPEGIIMGIGFLNSNPMGIKMSMLIFLHDIPEGLAVASSLLAINKKTSKVLLYSLITALPTLVGIFIGLKFRGITNNIIGLFLALVSGIMLYIVFFEMLRESIELSNRENVIFSILTGILLGLVIIFML
ncbi:ZIP family metal transporter [Clostridium sp. DL1XJH146]